MSELQMALTGDHPFETMRVCTGEPAGTIITFCAGSGGVNPQTPRSPGDIIFQMADGTEFLTLCGNGDAFVRGEKVASNQAVYGAFRVWLKSVTNF